jgi:succinyl-diaminopimelate desuccinylase
MSAVPAPADFAGETLRLAQSLIARASVTPADAGCLGLVERELAPLGFAFERSGGNGVENLWARRGAGRPLICFAGHTDVVPTGPVEKWTTPPFEPTIREGVLYGRGAADMKSSLAAFLVAIRAFVASRPHHAGSIAVLFTSDEEGPAVDGTTVVVERLKAAGERLDYCIVGEPTSVARTGDMIKNGRRGSLNGRLVARGVQAHIAYPHLGVNAVHRLAPALAELAQTEWDHGNDFFPPTTWQVSNIRAGTGATNVIPGEAEVMFNFRFGTASTVESLQGRLQGVLDRHGVAGAIDWQVSARPFVTARGKLVDALAGAIRDATGIDTELSTTGGTSDARFIADICSEIVEFGPVNETAHKIDERIPLADLGVLPAIYLGVLQRLLP